MMSSSYERPTIRQLIFSPLVFLASAIPTGLLLRIGWRDWTLFAVIWTAMYFMGAIGWLPWGTPVRKAFSYGILVGTALPALEWLSGR